MVRPIGLPRLAAGLVVFPFAALLAVSCGGSDTIDPADGSAPIDGSLGDAHADVSLGDGSLDTSLDTGGDSSDGASLDQSASDGTSSDGTSSDGTSSDGTSSDGTSDGTTSDAAPDAADAGMPDADAALLPDVRLDANGHDGGLLMDGGAGTLLGLAKPFTVLAGTAVTITPGPPPTTIFGSVGVSPGNSIMTLAGGQPTGGTVHAGDNTALLAQGDLTTAYNTLAGLACLPANDMTGVDLGGKTLAPAVYCFPNTSAGLTGNLVLDAQGNPNAVWVIQVGSTLTTATDSTVTVIGGGSACNVFWQIGSSATLGTRTHFLGSIVALTSITLVTGSTIAVGRTLARNGGVSLDQNAVSNATCQ